MKLKTSEGLKRIRKDKGLYRELRKKLAGTYIPKEGEDHVSPLFPLADEPTWRCHQNPFIGALGIQQPVIPGEPLIKG